MSLPSPGRALRLAVIGWGLGDLAMGRTTAGAAWLLAEVILLAVIGAATVVFGDTSWYLLPFLLGMAFIATWVGQAILAYRSAQRLQGAIGPTGTRSPALAVGWLTVPLLLWGTGFWLIAATRATPAAVVDRFVTAWAEEQEQALADVTPDPALLGTEARIALDRLRSLCSAGELPEDCGVATENLLRDVRVTITSSGERAARAVAELVSFERRPSTFLGIFQATELVPVPVEEILELELEAQPAALGAVRWTIVNAEAGE